MQIQSPSFKEDSSAPQYVYITAIGSRDVNVYSCQFSVIYIFKWQERVVTPCVKQAWDLASCDLYIHICLGVCSSPCGPTSFNRSCNLALLALRSSISLRQAAKAGSEAGAAQAPICTSAERPWDFLFPSESYSFSRCLAAIWPNTCASSSWAAAAALRASSRVLGLLMRNSLLNMGSFMSSENLPILLLIMNALSSSPG